MSKSAGKQLEVQIMGQSYLLACAEGGAQSLLEAVERVDSAMCRIRDAGKVKARDRIAVLASLNLAFELSQKETQALQTGAQAPAETSNPLLNDSVPDALSSERVNGLIQRIDQALENDGQLL